MGTIGIISTNEDKQMLKKLILPTILVLGVNASAAQSKYQDSDAKGLIGVEFGMIGTDYQVHSKANIADGVNINKSTTYTPSIGLKLGSESEDYRFFIESKIWNTDKYSYGSTVGASMQYLLRFNSSLNVFMGLNGGVINITKSNWDLYAGADAGINLGFIENFDLELGTRYSSVDINSDASGRVSAFYQLYVSAIFKLPSSN